MNGQEEEELEGRESRGVEERGEDAHGLQGTHDHSTHVLLPSKGGAGLDGFTARTRTLLLQLRTRILGRAGKQVGVEDQGVGGSPAKKRRVQPQEDQGTQQQVGGLCASGYI